MEKLIIRNRTNQQRLHEEDISSAAHVIPRMGETVILNERLWRVSNITYDYVLGLVYVDVVNK